MKTQPSIRPPHDLIAGFWHGHSSVTLTTREWKAVLLHYGADFLHMREGHGYHLRGKRVGPGIYSVTFVEPPNERSAR